MPPDDPPVLVLTRLHQDADIMMRFLKTAKLSAHPCRGMDDLCARLPNCLAAIVTIETLDEPGLQQLTECIAQQPPWSDIPFILLTNRSELSLLEKRLRSIANVTFLERPLGQSSLLSLVDSAVRARQKQFQVRDLLTQNRALTGERDAANRFLSELTTSLDEPFYKLDNDFRFRYINPAAMKWMEKPESEVIGKVVWNIYPHPMDTPLYRELLKARNTDSPRHFETFTPRLQKWVDVDIYPVPDGLLVFWHDISAQMQARKRIEELNVQLRRAMTETHHRVKNNLQLIAALVDMSMLDSENSVPIEDLRRLGLHINTLATVHDILTLATKDGHEGEDLSVKRVLENLVPLMQQSVVGRRIHAEIEEMTLPTRECTSLAMIVNELVSNALKHTRNDVNVRLCIENAQGVLEVEDDGEGFPEGFDPVRAANTGLELVLNLTRHDLCGTCEFVSQPGGGLVRVLFPLVSSASV